MATFAELDVASRDGVLFTKVKVASFIAANVVATESGATANHANRLLWAKQVYASPESEARRMVWAVLAANAGATAAQIAAVTDAQVQTAVNAAIDVFANGQA